MDVEFRLKHNNGNTHAEFRTANAALACQRGLEANPDKRVQTWFYIENAAGQRVTLKDQTRHPGHAYAILDALERKET